MRPADPEYRTVGHVREVTPTHIKVVVRREAPHGTAISAAMLHRFPHLNGLVTIPSEGGSILAMITWVGIDESPMPRNPGPDVLGLPTPHRVINVVPIGRLRRASRELESSFTLERGVLMFPTVGDVVRLPSAEEARAAIPHSDASGPTITLGVSAVDGSSAVDVSPNLLFGRHLAILGNTGSGKSCTLTHALREASKIAQPAGAFRAIVLDLNGEFANSFDDLPDLVRVKHLSVDPEGERQTQLRVPYWLWTYREWNALLQASLKSQAPMLRQALGMLREFGFESPAGGALYLIAARRVVQDFQGLRVAATQCAPQFAVLRSAQRTIEVLPQTNSSKELQDLKDRLSSTLAKRWDSSKNAWRYGAEPLSLNECQELLVSIEQAAAALDLHAIYQSSTNTDTPTPFVERDFPELLEVLAVAAGGDTAGWIAPMVERLRTALADERLQRTCGHRDEESLGDILEQLFGESGSQITCVDLSLIPSSAQQVVAAVIGRLVLEAQERLRRSGGKLPTLLAVEEAHSLILRRPSSALDSSETPMTDICREAFERIAREGRKYGLTLIISSQRPSELSETVLAQCNTYLVHRIVSHRDQEMVGRLIPDNMAGLLSEVPSYPARMALLVGAATDVPTLLMVSKLEKQHRPTSANPDFLGAWSAAPAANMRDLAAIWAPEHVIPEDPDPRVESAEEEPPF